MCGLAGVRIVIGNCHRLLLYSSIRNFLEHVPFLNGEKKELTTKVTKEHKGKQNDVSIVLLPAFHTCFFVLDCVVAQRLGSRHFVVQAPLRGVGATSWCRPAADLNKTRLHK
jgi:hypothetical protein